MKKLSACSIAALVLGTSVSAQTTNVPDALRWQAFAGCWQPVLAEGMPTPAGAPLLCVLPASTTAADIVTVVDGVASERQRIDANGSRAPMSKEGCDGWESANWSMDGRRVFLSAEHTCEGTLKRKSTGIFALTTTGEWVNSMAVTAAGGQGVRTTRYQRVAANAELPREITSALAGRAMLRSTIGMSAEAPVTVEGIVEAAKVLDTSVVQSWLAERGQGFNPDVQMLRTLKSAGVPTSIIDMVIAVSYPSQFSLGGGSTIDLEEREVEPRRSTVGLNDPYSCGSNYFDPWGYSYGFGSRYSRYANECSNYRGISRYGYGYGSYYDSYYGYGAWNSGRSVIVINGGGSAGGPAQTTSHGRVQKGQGYSQGSQGSGTPARSSGTSSGSTGSSSTTQSAPPTSGASSSGSGASTEVRTAKPRPPAN